MNVRVATSADAPKWTDYVRSHPHAHHAHDWRWQEVIREAFGHTPHYLIAESNSIVSGVCPLFEVRSMFSGLAFISMPYLNAGGVLSDDESVTQGMLKYIHTLTESRSGRYVELRYQREVHEQILPAKQHKAALQLSLASSAEEQFSLFPPKLRSQIRRPTKEGCSTYTVNGATYSPKDIQRFYAVFSQNMKSLGTPVFPKRLFSRTMRAFGADAELTIVRLRSTPVAAGITIRNPSKKYIEIPWAASLRQYNKCAPNMLLYWDIIKRACDMKYQTFDFGRSSLGSGTFKFKTQWGAEPVPLYWYYDVLEGDIPTVSPSNPKFDLLIATWRRMPLTLTNLIGPYLTRSLP